MSDARVFKRCALLVWTMWFLTTGVASQLFAENDEVVPSWRQGVSRWTGSGYEMPPNASVPTAKTTIDSSKPYTIPTDPLVSQQSNPYFQLPKTDDDAPLNLSVPSGLPKPEVGLMLAPPASTSRKPARINSPAISAGSEATSPVDETGANDSLGGSSSQELATTSEKVTDPDADKESSASDDAASKGSPDDASADSIGEIFASEGSAVEPAPLQSEVTQWYQYPRQWMRGWDSTAEFGIDGSDGNANTLAIQTGFELKRKSELQTLSIDVDYRQANSRNVTVENNGRLNIDYDRLLSGSAWAGFGKYGMEWDRFKAFDLRLNVNGGVGYHWIRNDDATFVTRFGAGASKEIGAPDDDWIAEAVFGVEAERQLTSRQKLKGKVDYFPAWENFGNYRLVSDVAWEILLDGSENLSLKLAATDRYDSTPQGAEPNDIYYSLLLLYKF